MGSIACLLRRCPRGPGLAPQLRLLRVHDMVGTCRIETAQPGVPRQTVAYLLALQAPAALPSVCRPWASVHVHMRVHDPVRHGVWNTRTGMREVRRVTYLQTSRDP